MVWTKTNLSSWENEIKKKIEEKTKRDKIKNEVIRYELNVENLDSHLINNRISWYERILRMPKIEFQKKIYFASY